MPDNLPQYRCHKIVGAVKIANIIPATGGRAWIVPEDKGSAIARQHVEDGDIEVGPRYLEKHKPQVGGYFVQYRDGYQSWSPASEFEDGYTRIDELPAGKLDAKFYGDIFKAKDDSLVPPDQWMVFLAKDNAFPTMLYAYLAECRALGCDAEHIASVERTIARMEEWRAAHPDLLKTPDAAGENLLA